MDTPVKLGDAHRTKACYHISWSLCTHGAIGSKHTSRDKLIGEKKYFAVSCLDLSILRALFCARVASELLITTPLPVLGELEGGGDRFRQGRPLPVQ